jgi:hypothetical protein
MQTANGVSQGWRIQLHSVRIGDVEVFDVEAVVTPAPMPLGNSFLNRFQMSASATRWCWKTAVSDTLPMHLASEGPSESYEDLLSLWSDLESVWACCCRARERAGLPAKMRQFDRWLQTC